MIKLIYLLLLLTPLLMSNKLVLKYYTQGISTAVECSDSNNCFMMTEADEDSNNPDWGLGYHRIYKSTNKGNSWQEIYKSESILEQIEKDPPSLIELKDGAAPNKNYIYLVMWDEPYIKKSTDGGKSFKKLNSNYNKKFREIEMKDTNIGIVTGDGFFFHITEDGWNTFTKRRYLYDSDNVAQYSLRSPKFFKDNVFFLGAIDFLDGSSKPGEALWEYNYKEGSWSYTFFPETVVDTVNNPNPIYVGLKDLFFVNDTLGFICGGKKRGIGATKNDIIIRTKDGGQTWEKVLEHYDSVYGGFGLQEIAFKNELIGIAVGELGRTVVTGDGGDTWEYLKHHDTILSRQAPTAILTWAGDYPIIGTYSAGFYRVEGPNGGPPEFKTPSIPTILAQDHNFGTHDISFPDTLSQKLKVYNTSDSVDLIITNYSSFSDSTFSTDLPMVDSINPIIINPQKFFEFMVYFSPKEVREYSDSIVFYSNAKDSDNVTYLLGKGIDTVEIGVNEIVDKNRIRVVQSDEQLIININDRDFQTYTIQILNVLGNILRKEKLNSDKQNFHTSVDLRHLINGTYLYMISCGGEIIKTGKFVLII